MDEQQFLAKLDRIKDIPTLPIIVLELNKLLRDPDTSIKTVCDTIEKDQAITLKILKLVNSAFYGFKSKISDLRNAVALLGYNAVRNAIVSLSVINSFPKRVTLKHFDSSIFWKHSLLRPSGRHCRMNRYPFTRQSVKHCRLIMPKSARIWRANGNCPGALWMRFAGIMSFSLNSRVQISYGTFTWPILLSTLTIWIRSFGWICQKCTRMS